MKVGDIGGAMSITEPMSIYEEGIAISVTQQALMVLIMDCSCGLGIFLAANRLLLRPIESLSRRRMILKREISTISLTRRRVLEAKTSFPSLRAISIPWRATLSVCAPT